jgi:hypothetical protein
MATVWTVLGVVLAGLIKLLPHDGYQAFHDTVCGPQVSGLVIERLCPVPPVHDAKNSHWFPLNAEGDPQVFMRR